MPVPIQGSWVFPLKVRIFLKRTYEVEVTNLVKRVIREGWVVVDVGTQYGYYTLLLARLVGAQGSVYAFDPDPVSFRRLVDNLRRNDYRNVAAINKGVSNRSGTAKFYASTLGYGKDTMFPKPNYPYPPHEFPTTTLDAEISDAPDFIKIDVEGAELLVLEGATRLLRNTDIGIVLEFHPRVLARTARSPEQVLEALHRMGFLTFFIERNGSLVAKTDGEMVREANLRDGINIFACKRDAIGRGGRFAELLS